jgi:hypothetical protein
MFVSMLRQTASVVAGRRGNFAGEVASRASSCKNLCWRPILPMSAVGLPL